ncbi:hypothetical protein HP532_01920 [Pseudomonas sp. CrR25]|nr:hypothetical protein [Pseudomonas sp. CrR25]
MVATATISGSLMFGMAEAKANWSAELILRKADKRYGRSNPAKERLVSWSNLIERSRHLPEREKLEAVNQFFNHEVRFSSDSLLWQQADYWATPVETLIKGAGDCEDFSLAKYFTLRQLGIAEEKLRVVYAQALRLGQAHMVLGYYSIAGADPLVLDNLTDSILPASARADLQLLYAFDAQGLYVVRDEGLVRTGDVERLPRWQALQAKMRQEGFSPGQG